MKRRINPWAISSMIIVSVIMLPAFEIFSNLFRNNTDAWLHIRKHLLLDYIQTSTILVFGTVLLSTLIGCSLAWFVTVYDFPLRKTLRLALILPIAIPPYIGAYTYVGMLSYTGPIQTFLRTTLGITPNQSFFTITNLPGAIVVFSIFLYPYVYLAVMAFLERNSAQIIESGRLLGDSSTRVFFRLILPLLRVPIVAGGTIVALDVLSDYALVSYFGIGSFSSAIFKAWQNLLDIHAALRLSAILLLFVLIVTSMEKVLRSSKKTAFASTKVRPIKAKRIKGVKRHLVTLYVSLVFAISLVIPLLQMMIWSIYSFEKIRKDGLITMAWNTVWVSAVATLIILLFSLIVANYRRLFNGFLPKMAANLSLIGYSIPGAVIAMSVLLLFLNLSPSLSQTIVMLIFAYFVRYFTISYQNIESGFEKVGLSFHNSSRLLGCGSLKTLFLVDLPMIKPALIAAFILTFVDIAKELTIVLILRPFNFYTLSTKVFEYAHDEMIPESSVASLLIIAVSMIPIFLYYLSSKKEIS